jgi:hypothetical protein
MKPDRLKNLLLRLDWAAGGVVELGAAPKLFREAHRELLRMQKKLERK